MRKFTVKDFITYNNPCFNCGNSITFKIGSYIHESNHPLVYLKPLVGSKHTEIDLLLSYKNYLTLFIHHKTNNFISNNMNNLKEYLETHRLFLISTCDVCYTEISSDYLEFDFDKNVVRPVGIENEILIVTNEKSKYQLVSHFSSNETVLLVYGIDLSLPSAQIKLSLLPKYKFKNKQHFIDKIKMYLTFS